LINRRIHPIARITATAWLWLCPLACSGPAPESEAAPKGAEISAPKPLEVPKGRVVILGFDGVEPRWLSSWAREGKLPAIKQLMDAHNGRGYHKLASTNPPQSPVAWTTFATGTLPGDHGIFDFIARTQNPSDQGMPVHLMVGTTSFEPQPSGPPVARNLRAGTPFWQSLANSGVRVVALNVPYSFPPDPMRTGRMLSGLGVPDLRETNSTFTYAGTDVTAQQQAHPPGGGVLAKIRRGVGRFELEGPTIPGGKGERMSLPVEVRAKGKNQMSVRLGGETHVLPLQTFSDFIPIELSHGAIRVRGIVRLLPLEVGKRTRLFVSPISFDPREPYSPISHPNAFSKQLVDQLGHLYKTVGWDHDTSALNAELIDEDAFLADLETIERDRIAMLDKQLAADDYDLLIWVSTATDRVAHMFYRLIDKEHPRYDAELAQRFGDVILKEYQRMDQVVASVLRKLKPEDTLLVLSDHGFHSYRRGLHVNQWLRSQGLLHLYNGAASGSREFLMDVDWAKTKAYAAGTGQIYFNVQGRERDGIVKPAEVAALTEQIRAGLLALRDKQRGDAQVVSRVYASEAFKGQHAQDAPDLQIGFAENYRTSWETVLGGVPAGLFADNDKKWSGDHAASDVAETPGVILSNRPLDKADPHIADIAPTAHKLFQKPVPPSCVGGALFGPQ
jgi:predicted AlkP superfamily phosphohydrolase/phosphomutase